MENITAMLNMLPEKVQEMFWDDLRNNVYLYEEKGKIKNDILTVYNMDILTNDCKSPIEQIFYVCCCQGRYALRHITKEHFWFWAVPQAEVSANGKTYYIDFMCNLQTDDGKQGASVCVECDGHIWHEKTKKQVIKDNERDYNLKMAGYDILHFSGSEIFNNGTQCAIKVFQYLKGRLNNE